MRSGALLSAVDWTTFWLAFLATAAGVILGIPAGIFLNTVLGYFNGRKARVANVKRLSDTLLAIAISLDVNDAALTRLQGSANKVLLSHGFDLATWDMAQGDVQKLVEPIDYRIPLAQYFEDVRQLVEILSELRDLSVGVNSTVVSQARSAYVEHIEKRTSLALEKGSWLRDQIVDVRGLRNLKEPLDPAPPP